MRIQSVYRVWLLSSLSLLISGSARTKALEDTVYTRSETAGRVSLVRGKVLETSAFKVVVDDDGRLVDVPAATINKVVFDGEPRAVARARENFESQRWDECLDSLAKIEEVPDSKFIQQEIDFLRAYAVGSKALRGDSETSIATAEEQLKKFVDTNSTSYRLVIAVDLYGQLLLANAKTAAAQQEFNKLTRSKWDQYVMRGFFFEGETYLHQENYAAAKKSYEALKAMEASGPDGQKFHLLAECQLAKINAIQGNPQQGVETLSKIIRKEDPDDTRLFAVAYNALGTCYLKTGEIKKACRAFLHTELLFASESNARAEALYHLTQIWPLLKESSRANEARKTLSTRYRNTIWAAKK